MIHLPFSPNMLARSDDHAFRRGHVDHRSFEWVRMRQPYGYRKSISLGAELDWDDAGELEE